MLPALIVMPLAQKLQRATVAYRRAARRSHLVGLLAAIADRGVDRHPVIRTGCKRAYAMLTFFGIKPELACYNEAAARGPTILDHMREGLRSRTRVFSRPEAVRRPIKAAVGVGKRSSDKVH
jgi:hypothetical protein